MTQMSYIKSYSFLKRTCVLLSPLFLLTLASKELAFYAPAATLSPILSDPKEEKNSVINLASALQEDLPESVENYGALKIQKTLWGEDLWVEETNSLATFSHRSEFKYQEADTIITKQDDNNENKYVLKKESFEQLKDKGDINVLTTFDLVASYSDPIPVTHIVSLSDLTSVKEKTYTIATTKIGQKGESKQHLLIVKKDESKQEITFELNDASVSKFIPSSSYLDQDLSSLAIKSFYILFNDNPPLNPNSYFSSGSTDFETIVGDVAGSKFKKVFLNKWNNSFKSKSSSEQVQEPKYDFKTNNGFWKSTCSDPYKVGGFIDKDLKDNLQQQQQQASKKHETQGSSHLEKQMKSWEEFFPFQKTNIERRGQYYWKDITANGAYVPHDASTKLYECKGVDEVTKQKFKEYLESSKIFTFEKRSSIEERLAPTALVNEVKKTNGQENNSSKYPYHKIIQSSFRAWGNAYLTSQNENLKEKGIYSSQFEQANHSNHTFTIKIKKEDWKKFLTEDKLNEGTLKKLNESPDVSSLLEVYYPLSFSFYDPISGYLKKHSLFLKTELDLSYLYLNSSYFKEVFKFDIGNENREIGKDYQGFDPYLRRDKEKPYGLDGHLTLASGIELDIEKNLNIHLTAKVSGFVNTKNPSCDLRHRLYKIDGSFNTSNRLDQKWNCSTESGWKYREHIHIPSYLVITLDKEPEVSSYYIDRQSGQDAKLLQSQEKEGDPKPIKTLAELGTKLDEKEIVTIIETDDSTKADVYFRDLTAYGDFTNEKGFHLNLNGWIRSGQQVYYWYPRRTKGKLSDVNFENLKSIKLKLSGSKNSYNAFFHSNHFNTLTTLCTSNKYTFPSPSQNGDGCADGNKYDVKNYDKTSSELHDLWGSQFLDIDVSESQINESSEDQAKEIKFRVTYNRADRRDFTKQERTPKLDTDAFETIKTKLEHLFQDKKKDPKYNQIPDVSMLVFWYSIFFWKDESKKELHYATQVRPVGLIPEKIKNATAHLTAGAAGSAGFEISQFELKYSKKN